jgi:hypothetical protein
MTRRSFFATLFVAPCCITQKAVIEVDTVYGAAMPLTGPEIVEQFDVSGLLERTGLEGEGYYAISQHFALMINPQKLPSLYEQAEKLVGQQARVRLGAA